jgi:aryl-alcohol dehydrogenase-like predicted oxidoreductase
MQYRRLGRTGLEVSVLGLGSGGASRLGQRYHLAAHEIAAIVRHALAEGVTLIDTAPGYGQSETVLGQALGGVPRASYVLCTKFRPTAGDALRPAGELRASLRASLAALRTDHIDVFYLHGVAPASYRAVRERFLPELEAVRAAGLVRHIGITEQYGEDHRHETLIRAVDDGGFEVIMVGLNLLSPAAVRSVLPRAGARGLGIVVMCAVRSILSDRQAVQAIVRGWQDQGLLAPGTVPADAPLDWLLDEHIRQITDAAYKFAAAQPGVSSVLTGTGNSAHLDANLRAILGSPLPPDRVRRVLEVFGPVQRNVQPDRTG